MDKVVLITGASSGIGAGTAKVLAAAAATVVLGARRADRLADLVTEIEHAGGTARAAEMDVRDSAQVAAFVAGARKEFGRVDVIVNNAGIMPLSPLAALKTGEWDWMIDVNIRGVLHGIAAVLTVFAEQGYGHVVNVSSVGGFVVQPSAAVYAATKFAVCAISEGLRKESPTVRCTCIYPGVVHSELTFDYQRRGRAEADGRLPHQRHRSGRDRRGDPLRHRAARRCRRQRAFGSPDADPGLTTRRELGVPRGGP